MTWWSRICWYSSCTSLLAHVWDTNQSPQACKFPVSHDSRWKMRLAFHTWDSSMFHTNRFSALSGCADEIWVITEPKAQFSLCSSSLLITGHYNSHKNQGRTRVSGDSGCWGVKKPPREGEPRNARFLWHICHEVDGETEKVWLEEKGGKLVAHMRDLMFWGADSPE